jgi:hypothetical protein
MLLDQGSGNGTVVNGRRVERHVLRDGDEIAMGDTRVRFIESSGVIAWSDTGPAGRGRAGHLWGATVVALCIVAAAVFVRHRRAEEIGARRAHAGALQESARAAFRDALAQAKEGRRAEARDRLRVATELLPGDPEIGRELESIEAEQPQAVAEPAASVAHPERTRPEETRHRVGGAGRAVIAERTRTKREEDARVAVRFDADGAITERARQLYLRAYLAKEDDPVSARKMFAEVAAMTSADDTSAKALRWLERLDGKDR